MRQKARGIFCAWQSWIADLEKPLRLVKKNHFLPFKLNNTCSCYSKTIIKIKGDTLGLLEESDANRLFGARTDPFLVCPPFGCICYVEIGGQISFPGYYHGNP